MHDLWSFIAGRTPPSNVRRSISSWGAWSHHDVNLKWRVVYPPPKKNKRRKRGYRLHTHTCAKKRTVQSVAMKQKLKLLRCGWTHHRSSLWSVRECRWWKMSWMLISVGRQLTRVRYDKLVHFCVNTSTHIISTVLTLRSSCQKSKIVNQKSKIYNHKSKIKNLKSKSTIDTCDNINCSSCIQH